MDTAPGFSLHDLLRFYAEAGVDDALEEEAVDRFAESARQAARAAMREAPASFTQPETEARPKLGQKTGATPTPIRPSHPVAVPEGSQADAARQLAAAAQSLDDLRAAMESFEGCNLRLTAKQMVFADGNPQADLMLVGEAPGRDEDIEGLPFVGRSGQLLDRILAAIGRDRTSVYIANVIPWRPPGNRTPTPIETEICRPFIERQIELVGPKVLVTLGAPSAKTLLRTNDAITRLRGNWRAHVTPSGAEIPTMPTLHPAYLLRTPAHKKLAWRDFLDVKARLG